MVLWIIFKKIPSPTYLPYASSRGIIFNREYTSEDFLIIPERSPRFQPTRRGFQKYKNKAAILRIKEEKAKMRRHTMAEGRNNGANLGFENQMCATAEVENAGIPFYEKMSELSAKLYKQFAESERLE